MTLAPPQRRLLLILLVAPLAVTGCFPPVPSASSDVATTNDVQGGDAAADGVDAAAPPDGADTVDGPDSADTAETSETADPPDTVGSGDAEDTVDTEDAADTAAPCPLGCAHLDAPCLEGVCEAGTCVARPHPGPCDDDLACTAQDACVDGACHGVAIGCSDGIACTLDACKEPGGCTHPVAPGACLIAGVCHATGDLSADLSGCGRCDPAVSPVAWSARGGTNPWPLAEGAWAGAGHEPLTMTRYCRPVALGCHNCYAVGSDPVQSLSLTRSRLLAALEGGLDALEVDVRSEAGVLRVSHEDDATVTGAQLSAILAPRSGRWAAPSCCSSPKNSTPTRPT